MRLSDAQIRQYHEQGYLCPIRVFSPERAAACRRQLEAAEAANGGPLQGAMKQKPHLLFTWLDELVRDRRARCGRGRDRSRHPVLGEQLLHQGGARPELRLLASGPHLLGPGAGRHRDRLDRALAEHARERLHARGPGSHKRDVLPHTETFARAQPALARPGDPGRGRRTSGQGPDRAARRDVAASRQADPRLRANRADDRRIGFAIRYVPTYVRQTAGAEDSAMLVRGVDVHHIFSRRRRRPRTWTKRRWPARGGDRPRRTDPHARHGPGELRVAPPTKQPSGRGRNV